MEKRIELKQADCPLALKKQIIALLRQEWSHVFSEPIGGTNRLRIQIKTIYRYY